MELIIGWVSRNDKKMCHVGIVLEIESMESFGSWLEFNESARCMDFKNTPAIETVVCDVVRLAKLIEQQYIGNPILVVEINFSGSKIGDSVGSHDALVAMNVDGLSRGTDIVNVIRVGEEVGCALAVKEEVVGVNGGLPRVLSEDDYAGCIAGNRGIVRFS